MRNKRINVRRICEKHFSSESMQRLEGPINQLQKRADAVGSDQFNKELLAYRRKKKRLQQK